MLHRVRAGKGISQIGVGVLGNRTAYWLETQAASGLIFTQTASWPGESIGCYVCVFMFVCFMPGDRKMRSLTLVCDTSSETVLLEITITQVMSMIVLPPLKKYEYI